MISEKEKEKGGEWEGRRAERGWSERERGEYGEEGGGERK